MSVMPPRTRHSAVLLGALWCLWLLLIVYASFYPFTGWHDQGLSFASFVFNPWPRYWTSFDIYANVLGYIPFGMLCVGLFLGARWPFSSAWAGLCLALIVPCALSFAMESTQLYLPQRVASNLDWAFNSIGGVLGVILGLFLLKKSRLRHGSYWIQQQANQTSNSAFILLLLWPLCLLYPTAIPFGLGQVYPVLQPQLLDFFMATVGTSPDWLVSPKGVVLSGSWGYGLSIFTGLFAPSVLILSVLHSKKQRCLGLMAIWVLGCVALTLSVALSYSLPLALTWLTPTVLYAMALAVLLSLLGVFGSSKLWYLPLLICLVLSLYWLNQQAISPYFTNNLQAWDHGRFANFYGFAKWLGWLWPFVLLLWCIRSLWRLCKSRVSA